MIFNCTKKVFFLGIGVLKLVFLLTIKLVFLQINWFCFQLIKTQLTVFNLKCNLINLYYQKLILSCFEKVAFLLDITEVITNKRTCIFGDINHDKKNPKLFSINYVTMRKNTCFLLFHFLKWKIELVQHSFYVMCCFTAN